MLIIREKLPFFLAKTSVQSIVGIQGRTLRRGDVSHFYLIKPKRDLNLRWITVVLLSPPFLRLCRLHKTQLTRPNTRVRWRSVFCLLVSPFKLPHYFSNAVMPGSSEPPEHIKVRPKLKGKYPCHAQNLLPKHMKLHKQESLTTTRCKSSVQYCLCFWKVLTSSAQGFGWLAKISQHMRKSDSQRIVSAGMPCTV